MTSNQAPMSHSHLVRYGTAFALSSLFAMVLVTSEAQARDRSSSITGSGGKSAQRHITRAAGSVNTSTTGPNGKTSSRLVNRSAAGATATSTGPNGQIMSRNTTRTDSGSSTTITNSAGETGTITVTH